MIRTVFINCPALFNTHVHCILQYPDYEGVVNEDLPNSWECPRCCQEGKNVEYKVHAHLQFVN